MNTVKIIQDILDRKKLLEENIYAAKTAINHQEMTDLVTQWTRYSARIDVRIPRERIIALLKEQLKSDTDLLEAINKKLDAIGAIMGAADETRK